jgi:PAS domain S-box-containing protein
VTSGATATTFLGLAGVVFMFGLAIRAAGRSGSHGAGAFAAYSAVAGLRLLMDVLLPLLPLPWATGASVIRHLAVWIGPLLGLLFALRLAEGVNGVRRWRTMPFWVAGATAVVVVVTNPIHGWYLRSGWVGDAMALGPLGWGMFAITNVGVLAVIVVLLATLVRAEGRRGPLALVIAGGVINWSATALPLFAWSPFAFGQVDVVMRTGAAGLYAVALFGFGLLRLVPVGREAALRQMDEGWLVLDTADRIADLNPAAERMFAVRARAVIGREARGALRGVEGLDALWSVDADDPRDTTDVQATAADPERHLDVHVTPLLGRHGTLLGRTLMVRDVTALRRAEALALDRERALAALQERERVARELHDGLAQVLGFLRLQAEAARGLLRHDAATAEAYLTRLSEAALDAHGEARSFIAGSAAGSKVGWPAAIAASVQRLREDAGLEIEFSMQEGLGDDELGQPVAAHLLRIVQEALHNVRKHARASRVTVAVEARGAWLDVVVADDGAGFTDMAAQGGSGYGLGFMHERAAAAGGTLAIASGPHGGTRVAVRVPRREPSSVADASAAGAVPAAEG